MKFSVKKSPSNEHSLTNKLFINPADHATVFNGRQPTFARLLPPLNAAQPPAPLFFQIAADASVSPGEIGLSSLQRRQVQVALDDTVTLEPSGLSAESVAVVVRADVDLLAKVKSVPGDGLQADHLQSLFAESFVGQPANVGQQFLLIDPASGIKLKVTVSSVSCVDAESLAALLQGDKKVTPVEMPVGIMSSSTSFSFKGVQGSPLRILGGESGNTHAGLMLDWDFEKMGIGGLDAEFNAIFRRAFASRLYPPAMLAKLGWNPVRGVLLYGPPGTGKTLMARQIGKMLNGREPKIVAGPEVLNKFVGQSEENIRNLFKEAEEEQEKRGEDSDLHIIIMDELDAICRSRGTRGDSTGVGDTVVNQLLAKIDGVNSLNNVLIIGMTNRLDMIDPALLRPGRLEVHIEIGLPDEHGRVQIFNIHTSKMRENGFLADDVNVESLAERTKNYSGAEIGGVVKNATSWAMRRQVNPKELEKPPNIDELIITMEDFENALTEVKPAFGVSKKDFDGLVPNGIVLHGVRMKRLVDSCHALLNQVQSSSKTRRVTALLAGPRGCGKTALASHLALSAGYPFVKLISPEQLVGLSEPARLTQIYEAFEAAYKSPLSVLVIDDVERLFDYVPAMPVRFSNMLLQGLSVLLGKPPPKDRRLCVIATTSNIDALKSLGVMESFDATFRVPLLESEQEYLTAVQDEHIEAFEGADAARVAAEMAGKAMPIKKLIMLAEMAKQGPKDTYVDRFMEFAQEQE